MRRLAIIGHPVGHSLSPIFQNAALEFHRVDARYEAVDLPVDWVGWFVEGLRAPEWLGVNVTVPHKERVFRLVDEVDEVGQHVGAVNTVLNREGRLFATNTDVAGFIRSMDAAGVELPGSRALVLGAGGSARSAVYALARAGASVTVANRTRERSEALVDWIRRSQPQAALRATTFDASELTAEALVSDLIVNCTPMGMLHGPAEDASPLPADALHGGQVVMDLVYIPAETPLLATARAVGAEPIGGLEMLIQQGAEAFEQWTGLPAPVDVMRRAAQAALAGAGS